MPKKKNKPPKVTYFSQIKKLLPLFIVLLVAVGGLYSYRLFKNSGIETEGIVVCNDAGVCEKSVHIHASLAVNICGEQKLLPKDTGKLNSDHTHKEDNLLHFHERLKLDKDGQILDKTPLLISTAIQDLLGIKLTNSCIGEYCNGKACKSDRVGKVRLHINGEGLTDIEKATWQDGDVIELSY